jgi:hypothetical protein
MAQDLTGAKQQLAQRWVGAQLEQWSATIADESMRCLCDSLPLGAAEAAVLHEVLGGLEGLAESTASSLVESTPLSCADAAKLAQVRHGGGGFSARLRGADIYIDLRFCSLLCYALGASFSTRTCSLSRCSMPQSIHHYSYTYTYTTVRAERRSHSLTLARALSLLRRACVVLRAPAALLPLFPSYLAWSGSILRSGAPCR